MTCKNKKIVFLNGTRADFGKFKSLIDRTKSSNNFDVNILITGMHLSKLHGYTIDEIINCDFNKKDIPKHILCSNKKTPIKKNIFGDGNSDVLFFQHYK